jgi:hypothetical protein
MSVYFNRSSCAGGAFLARVEPVKPREACEFALVYSRTQASQRMKVRDPIKEEDR